MDRAREVLRRTRVIVREGPFALGSWPAGTALLLRGFGFVVHDDLETTALVAESELTDWPPPERVERGWAVLTLDLEMEWDLVGVLAIVTEALARANVSLGAYAAFRRDHVFVRCSQLSAARAALKDIVAES